MLLLTVPIFFPIITSHGFDPIWYGVVMVILIEAALIAPPVWMNCLVFGKLYPDIPFHYTTLGFGILSLLEILYGVCRNQQPNLFLSMEGKQFDSVLQFRINTIGKVYFCLE